MLTIDKIYASLWDGLICAPNFSGADASTAALSRLPDAPRRYLLKMCLDLLPASRPIINLKSIKAAHSTLPIFNGVAEVPCPLEFLTKCLDDDPLMLTKVSKCIPTGSLTWPSPVDGRLLATDVSLCLGDFSFAYRLVDSTNELVFYAVVSGFECRTIALFFPADRQIFCGQEETAFRTILPDDLPRLFLKHAFDYSELLAHYIAAPKRGFVWYARGFHFGHLLCDDLSCVDQLTHDLSLGELPPILLRLPPPSDGDIEVFGKLDQLFPELSGKVTRSHAETNDIVRQIYTDKLCVLRPTRTYVSRRLAQRVIDFNIHSAELESEQERLREIKSRRWPLIVVDLRVESRTIVDLPGFCVRLTEFLLAETNGVGIVFSGHTGSYFSIVDATSKRPPIELQKEIVIEVASKFRDPNVTFVDCIGVGMQRTIFWSYHAHFFVAPWGGSLATYRWICNKPGLIMTNRSNLRWRGVGPHSDVYAAPLFMEDPAPVCYLSEEDIEDDPESCPLSSWQHEGQPPETFYNFRVNEVAVFSEVRRLLREVGPSEKDEVPTGSSGQTDSQIIGLFNTHNA